ncbi:MAG: hypothetical protein ABI442_09055 [Gemmatimonadaceae bacterium]
MVALVGVSPVVARAQASVEIGPLFGYYHPAGHFDLLTGSIDGPHTPSELSAYAFGAEIVGRFSPTIGVRAEAFNASQSGGQHSVATPGAGIITTQGTSVSVASAQALFDFVSDSSRNFWLSAGPGLVHHGGAAYARGGSPTDLAAGFGSGAEFNFHKSWRFTAGVSGFYYFLDARSQETGTQIDLLFRVGFVWAPSRR